MPLQAGTHLGPYEVLSLIGSGGMGEVYRARDTRLGREVAIKVLPPDRVTDADRRRRFVQEAQAASALSHPHIITIYEIESADGNDFIVMEYVRGKSLDAVIPRQGMRLNEALRIAIAVADALAAAHARGIIHRDLKPANVIVGTDGTVKVLDFGLAKLIRDADTPEEDSPTRTSHALVSAPGTIAGTAAYMAPEQAMGGTVDARTDIFSFGAMLYEMVTGSRAFPGASTADTLSAVIRAEPKPPSAVVTEIQSDLEKVILRCLRKGPQRRYQHLDDVKVALEDIKEESESGASLPAGVVRKRRPRLIATFAAAALVIVIVAAVAAWLLLRSLQRAAAPPAMRVVPLTTMAGLEFHPTFSPDGNQVAFTWNGPKQDNWDIYVTIVGSANERRLTSDPGEDVRPAWSPDGREIAFIRQQLDDSTIYVVSPLGGVERRVGDFHGADSIAWSPDGRWLAVGNSGYLNFGMYVMGARPGGRGPRGIYLIPAEGGDPRPLIASQPGRADSNPAFSPDGRRLSYVSCRSTGKALGRADCNLYVVDVNTARASAGTSRLLTSPQLLEGPVWTRDGSAIIYTGASDVSPNSPLWRTLWRVPVDGRGAPERLDIAGDAALNPALATSRDRLTFARVWRDADIYRFDAGRSAHLVAGSSFEETEPRFSPDGRKLVFASARSAGLLDIWATDADGANAQQITHGPGVQGSPFWSPDARRIVFDSQGDDRRSHVWMIDSDGGAPRQLTTEAGDQVVPTWSRDGKWIYFSWSQASGRDIWRIPAGGGAPQRLTHGADGPFACESADGKSLLFQTKDADSPLMMVSLAGGDARQLVACVRNSAFGVGARGVYYVPCDPSPDRPLHVMDPRSGRDERLGTLEALGDRPLGLSVAPDGNAIVYRRDALSRADLMLIENFR
jgi:Tol biopolymer transport system component/predicted Ser/Thr protein kinase